MPLTYEPKVRLSIIKPDGTETILFLRGNFPVAEPVHRLGCTEARHKDRLLNGNELLKELADEYGLTLHVS